MRTPRNPWSSTAVRWFGILTLAEIVSAFAAAYLPHRGFVHYLLFPVIPVCLGMAWTLMSQYSASSTNPHASATANFRMYVSIFVAFLVTFQLYGWSSPATDNTHNQFSSIGSFIVPPEGPLIRSLTSPHDQIRVWGWTVGPYLASAREGEGRDTDVLYLFRKDRLGSFYVRRFVNDMQQKLPALFIDAVGPSSWFLRDPSVFGFEHIPAVAAIIQKHYVHLGNFYDQRYYLRNDLAAKREATYNISLSTKVCDAKALRCLATPITLPATLPALQIPKHALLEAEFVPVGTQIGPATVFNNEAIPNSCRGFRFVHTTGENYALLVGIGRKYVASREFNLPERKPVWLTVEFNDNVVKVKCNSQHDELHLPNAMADAAGTIQLNSWLGDSDPFIGKMQFFQVTDLTQADAK